MSSTGMPVHVLRVQYRAEKCSIDNTLREADNLLKFKKDYELPQLDFDLSEADVRLKALYGTCIEIAEQLDTAGKSGANLQEEQDRLFIDYDKLYSTYRDYKGQYVTLLHAVKEKKAKAEQSKLPERQSLRLNVSSLLDTNSVKLPRVQLKKFNGNCKEFHDWGGLFENIIVNDDRFDDVQKLYYLKMLLEGDALKLVANVPYEASAFELAWKEIKNFYGNKCFLIAQHFGEIIDLPPI